jgi:hypothetical protein
MNPIRYDDIFTWDGWGGEFKLSSGSCHLRIFDLRASDKNDPVMLKPIIALVSDLPETYHTPGTLSIRSSAGNIATKIVRQFDLPPHRFLYIEFHPSKTYGNKEKRTISERYEIVDFKWQDKKAFPTQWRPLDATLKNRIREWMALK